MVDVDWLELARAQPIEGLVRQGFLASGDFILKAS
jgi:hypothetical protein